MSEQDFTAVRFYDALRDCNVRMLDCVEAPCRDALLEQMVGALVSVVVERNPAEAERLWFAAARDVRLRPPAPRRVRFWRRAGAAMRRAAEALNWLYVVAVCGAIWGAVVGSLFR